MGLGEAGEPEVVARLGLEPHPEGGWFRRVWTAGERVDTARGTRPAATAIHYALAPGERSRWHRVASEELWLWSGGGPLRLTHAARPEEAGQEALLGPDPEAGHALWAAVPAGRWQRAEPAGESPVLVTCVVAPGFAWSDFTMGPA